MVLALAVADMVVHYHIDFTKENIVKIKGWTIAVREFWWALGDGSVPASPHLSRHRCDHRQPGLNPSGQFAAASRS